MKIYNDPTYDILTIKVNKEEVIKAFSSTKEYLNFREMIMALLEQEIKNNDT